MSKNNKEPKHPVLKRIREIQLMFFKSQLEMANFFGRSQSTFNGWFRADNPPSVDFIIELLTKMRTINAEWLLLGIGEMEKAKSELSSIEITPANEYLIKRFEELVVENTNQKNTIKELEEEITRLTKKNSGYDVAAEDSN